jgi:hypothetical protein
VGVKIFLNNLQRKSLYRSNPNISELSSSFLALSARPCPAGLNPLLFQKKAGGAKRLKSCLRGQSIQLDEDNGLEQYSDDLHDDLVKRENR